MRLVTWRDTRSGDYLSEWRWELGRLAPLSRSDFLGRLKSRWLPVRSVASTRMRSTPLRIAPSPKCLLLFVTQGIDRHGSLACEAYQRPVEVVPLGRGVRLSIDLKTSARPASGASARGAAFISPPLVRKPGVIADDRGFELLSNKSWY